MEDYKHKKDSFFHGVFPSGEPSPDTVPVPKVHSTDVSVDQAAELNNKIELLGRTISGQIEKKFSELVLSSPPAAVPAPAVLSKLAEIENGLADLRKKLAPGAALAKNAGKSETNVSREIGELLRVLREQRKYAEQDRQRQDQLEKILLRVEEMEKRMTGVFSAAAKKPVEISAEALKVVGAGFKERFAPLETVLKNTVATIETIPAASRGLERRVGELFEVVESTLSFLPSEIRKLHSEYFTDKERMEDLLAGMKKDLVFSVREAFSEVGAGFLDHIDSSAIDGRERVGTLGKLLEGRLDQLADLGGGNALKIEALGNCVRSGNDKTLSVISLIPHGLENMLRAHLEESAAENARQLEKIKETYGLSNDNAVAAAGNISRIEARLAGLLAGLKSFTKALEPVTSVVLRGVTGNILRTTYESSRELVAGLEKEIVLLAKAKAEIEADLKGKASRTGGERE